MKVKSGNFEMSSALTSEIKEKFPNKIIGASIWKTFLIAGIVFYFVFFVSTNHQYCKGPLDHDLSSGTKLNTNEGLNSTISPTNVKHLLFGLVGSEEAWHHRKTYIESWWKSDITRGYLFLDKPPTNELLPWSAASPPFRISQDLTKYIEQVNPPQPVAIRILHGILETFREDNKGFRWLVMGDDDSIFFLDNMVEFLAKYDHTKYYYFGTQSEYVLSNFWCSFKQGFGGAGFILSYPLAKALADYMETCMRRYSQIRNADHITMSCIADIGVNLSPNNGLHQVDLHGDISGFLSAHPKTPLLSLHHFDEVEPIFPGMDRMESTRHLMIAATPDQSRMLQQTICYKRQKSWSISIAWGYSVQIYENIFPRSLLQTPIETFQPWYLPNPDPPHYMLNTRLPSNDPCEAPHMFFFKSIKKISTNQILTTYYRSNPRGLPPCANNATISADVVTQVHVYSSATKRREVDRCECCNITYRNGRSVARVKFRECHVDEIIG